MLRLQSRLRQLACFLLLTASPWSLAEDVNTVNSEMQKAGSALSALIPFIYNDTRFRNPGNREMIELQLDQLIRSMQASPNLMNDHALLRRLSQTSVQNQLVQARDLFKSGNYATAQYLLSGVPVLCSNCHIQDGITASSAPAVRRDQFANDYSFAEFNYYIRNYPVAMKGFEQHLAQKEVQSSLIQGGKTLERLLDITLITHRQPAAISERLREYQQLPDLELELKQRIEEWIKGLASLQQAPTTDANLEATLYREFSDVFNLKHEFILDESRRPLALAWRAQLQKASHTVSDKTETARHLYLISILERMLGDQSELSLANLYLKECVQLSVPTYSRKCLNEYEAHLYFYYGGSAGVNLPPEVMQELNTMRASLKPGL